MVNFLIGDKVLAEDPETGDQGYFEVVALTSHPEDEILHITIEAEAEAEAEENSLDTTPSLTDNNDSQPNNTDHPQSKIQNLKSEMEVTPDHPIYVEGQGWLWAENLSIGDTLRRADGGTAKVLAIERVKLAAPQLVYNFTVKGPHTYFVLEVGVLVHNNGSCEIVTATVDEVAGIIDDIRRNSPGEIILRGEGRGYPLLDNRLVSKKFQSNLVNGETVEDIAKNIDINGVKAEELLAQGRVDEIRDFYHKKMLDAFVKPEDAPQGFIGGLSHKGSSTDSAWISTTTSPFEASHFVRGGGSNPRDSGHIIIFSPTDPLRPAIPNDFNKNELEILVPVGISEADIHTIIHIEKGLKTKFVPETTKEALDQWLRMGGVHRNPFLKP